MSATRMVVVPSPMPVVLAQPGKDPKNNDELTVRVNPGTIRLGSKPYRVKQVMWINETGDDVIFTFDPNGSGKFFNNPPKGPFRVKLGDPPFTLTVSDSAPENCLYKYHVDCNATPGVPAQGNSEPEVSCP